MIPPGIKLRPMTADDRGFIVSTWLRSAFDHAKVPRDIYWGNHGKLLDSLLNAGATVVACSETQESAIHGYACADAGSVLHWAYVPPELRGTGLGRELVKAALGDYPAKIVCSQRAEAKSKRYVFNPYVLMVM